MDRVLQVTALDDFRIHVDFEDGVSGEYDVKPLLYGPVFEPLKNPGEFARVFVDEFGAVRWPNGADLAPDALYESIVASEPARK